MTKAEIIDAAFKVWGREFYLNTSLSQLACELKVSKTALYRHFKHKQALFDAMTTYFYDEISAFIRNELVKSPDNGNPQQNVFKMTRAVAAYYGRKVNLFVFALVRIYDRENGMVAETEMKSRGVNIDMLNHNDPAWPLTMRMVFSTITFFMADFHKACGSFFHPPMEDAISARIDLIGAIIERGLGYSVEEINALDYEKLEQCVAGRVDTITDDPLFKAVAQAVAEAGPWEASMEQVARYSGLSKSSLYGHFKNKEDMLRRFFVNEFMHIIEFTRRGMECSAVPLERLYLGIFSITVYLGSKPEIRNTLDQIRTRRLDSGWFRKNRHKENDGPPLEFLRLFEDFEIKPLAEASGQCLPHWILFLIVGMLMRQDVIKEIQHKDIRTMYRYLTSGIKGINEYEKNN